MKRILIARLRLNSIARTKSNLNFVFVLFLTMVTQFGCQNFNRRNSSNKKIDQTHWIYKNHWVRSTLTAENEGFRKIQRFTPLLAGDKVIVGNSLDGLSAFQAQTGNRLWKIDIKDGIEASGAAVRDRVFVSGAGGGVYCYSISKGELIWKYNISTEVLGAPQLIEDIVVVQTGAGFVVALDAVSGTPRWSYTRNENTSINLSIRGASSATYMDGSLYLGFFDGSVVSLSAATGKLQWESQINRNKRFKDIDSTPVIYKDSLIVSGFDEKIYRIDRKTGQTLWGVPGGGAYAAFIKDDIAYVSSSEGILRALSLKEGAELWNFKSPHGIMTSSSMYKGQLVVGESQGGVVLIDFKTGKMLSRFSPGRGVLATPLVDEKNQKIYFISGEGNLYQISFLTESSSMKELH